MAQLVVRNLDLISRMSSAGISGSGTYDALVAETARLHELELVTLDRRASATYEAVGVIATLLA